MAEHHFGLFAVDPGLDPVDRVGRVAGKRGDLLQDEQKITDEEADAGAVVFVDFARQQNGAFTADEPRVVVGEAEVGEVLDHGGQDRPTRR